MRFLFRLVFWLGVVLVFLPSGGSKPAAGPEVSAAEALSAAKATVGDVRQFCERQAEACTVGSQAMTLIGQRAQAGAKMLYDFLTEQFGPGENVTTASTKSVPRTAALPSRNTLTPGDLAPAWRGPQARRADDGRV